jgi:hypothetical protein
MSTRKNMDRSEVTKHIKKYLRERTGRDWSVTGGRGTAWGWLRIEAPKKRRVCHDENPAYEPFAPVGDPAREELPWIEREPREGEVGYYTPQEDRLILAEALGIGLNQASCQGVSISPDSWDFYLDRAENGPPLPEPEPEVPDIPEWCFEEVPEPPMDVALGEVVGNLFVEVELPRLNKNGHIEEYHAQFRDGENYAISREKAKVTHRAELTTEQHDALTRGNLLTSLPWLGGLGGCGSTAILRDVDDWLDYTEEEQELWKAGAYIKVVEVTAPGRGTIYVNPQGHGYARYVAFPLGFDSDEEVEEVAPPTADDPVRGNLTSLLQSMTPGQVLDGLIASGLTTLEALEQLSRVTS